MAESILSRSWLFEILNTKNSQIDRSFTLILPPQNYSIKEKQRVSITKTFGNAFIDDYGPDNLEITIKGISGTARVFPTYTSTGTAVTGVPSLTAVTAQEAGATQGYTGRMAFFKFRDDIMRYKDRANYENKELRVYDLYDGQAYKCALLEFTLDRTNDLPFRYPFTISLFVYERLDRGVARAAPIKIWEDPYTLLDRLDNAMVWLTDAATEVREIRRSFAKINNMLVLLRGKFNTYFNDATSIVTLPLDLIGAMLQALLTLAGIIADARDTAKYLPSRIAAIAQSNAASIQSTLRLFGYTVTAEVGGTISAAVDASTREYATDTPASEAQEVLTRVDRYTYNAFTPYVVKGGDTLQSIAQDQLGDEALWPHVASVNDVEDNEDLTAGMMLVIPVTSTATSNKDDYILTEDRARDPYGADIAINTDGSLAVTDNGDLATLTGMQVILQAIDIALSTPAGALIKQSAYGLIVSVGQPGVSMAVRYLRMNIKSTLLQDPRIESVDNLIIDIKGDAIQISMDITPVGYDTTIPVVTTL